MAFPSITSWKDHFTKKSHCRIFQQSPTTIRDSISPSINVFDSIMEISKNPRITLLALDASEGNLQLFHHLTTTGVVVRPEVSYLRVVGSFPTQWTGSVLSRCV